MSQEKIPMKKLTRMKLINWHRFTDCTIDFGDFTLLSGENGAGKSTFWTRFSLSSPVLPAILIKRLTKMESAS